MDGKYTWKSERRFRSELDPKKVKDVAIPDGLITTRMGLVAVEVEISIKKPADLEAKLQRLVRQSSYSLSGGHDHAFSSVWFYVPDEKGKEAIQTAARSLREDERKRVAIGREPNIVASRFRSRTTGCVRLLPNPRTHTHNQTGSTAVREHLHRDGSFRSEQVRGSWQGIHRWDGEDELEGNDGKGGVTN
jgi:hypothetical protein